MAAAKSATDGNETPKAKRAPANRTPKALFAVLKGAPRDVLQNVTVELTRDAGAVIDIVNDAASEAVAKKVAPVK